ncbi:MAG: RNB domain-containing ribonuclease [Steroidobacteraceae bacterium]
MDQPRHQRQLLADLAEQVMRERGLTPDFPADVLRQLADIHAIDNSPGIADLTILPWCSIDNDDSRDLDQLTVIEALPGGSTRLHVAVADVDALVPKDSPIDRYAAHNTTSVYTPARIFPMLPEKLSTDLTSLNPGQMRLAMVTSIDHDAEGVAGKVALRRARVHSKAKLAYDSIAAWLENDAPLPAVAAAVAGLDQQLRNQDALAQRLRERRRELGALEFQTLQPKATFAGDDVANLEQQEQNRARQLIEEFMIATNGAVARFLDDQHRATIQRVVRSPERWTRIRDVVGEYGETLPPESDGAALQRFLAQQRVRDPVRFPDLSLTLIKLMGAGEYEVHRPGSRDVGHFGLAVSGYSHSTAPNRRFPDLVTSRLVKAALAGAASPYAVEELAEIAEHCTRQEDAANKVERQIRKSAAAMLLSGRVGERFDAVVTGVSKGNTWVRIFRPPAEGMLRGARGQRVGKKMRVRLVDTNVERGFIDFEPG